MLKIKDGVKPKAFIILAAIANTAVELELPFDVFITSGNDGIHMKKSKHYIYEAVDVRTKNFPSSAAKGLFVSTVLRRLGKNYQGFIEDENGTNEHAHFEHDPKN